MNRDIHAWFGAHLPKGWFAGPPEIKADGEEILFVGTLADVEPAEGMSPEARSSARAARIDSFREDTREARVRIAREAERRFRRSTRRRPRPRPITTACKPRGTCATGGESPHNWCTRCRTPLTQPATKMTLYPTWRSQTTV
jgi:hypothetical protein